MDFEKVSIIVPLYNSASVIKRCMLSVLNQTYTNLELVLVDDGSTDSSMEICLALQKSDDRVKIFQKKNGGASSARNYGIEKATGTWVTFLDSDDYLEPNFLTELMAFANSCPLLVGGFKRFGDKVDEAVPEEQHIDIKKDLEDLWNKSVRKFIYWFIWGKIYRTEVIKKYNLRFEERMFFSEDLCFLLSYMACIDSFYVRRTAGYSHLYEKDRARKYKMDFSTFERHISLQNKAFEKLETKHGHFYKLVRQNIHRRMTDNFLYNMLDAECYSVYKHEWFQFRSYKYSKELLDEITTTKTRKLVNFLVFKTFPVIGYGLRCILKKHLA